MNQSRSTAVPVAIAAFIFLIVGTGLGMLLGFAIFSDKTNDDSRAATNVAQGCAIIERLSDEMPFDREKLSLKDPQFFELLGAAGLFQAASRADEKYESWEKLGSTLMMAAQRVDIEKMNDELPTIIKRCEDSL